MTQFVLVNKPAGWTSHDVVGYLRKVTGEKRIGHAGTLDPFATGLLIVGIGREATKRLDEFKGMDKTYVAGMRLGAVSDTYDLTGVVRKTDQAIPDLTDLTTTLQRFVGVQEQIPPMYSAKKVGGKKLYELARKGIEVERKPHQIEIYRLSCQSITDLNTQSPLVMIEVVCSVGTYIRTLVHDIGQYLGCGAYCESLQRTAIGDYKVDDANDVQSCITP